MTDPEGAGMRVLVVVGETEPPERLVVRADRVLHTPGPELEPQLLADVRAHIPEDVAVVGAAGRAEAAAAAAELRAHGFPVTLYTDTPPADPDGLRVRPLTDAGPAMEVADSLLDLVGNTPLVRLDRVGKRLDCQLLAKCEFLNAGGSVKDRPAVAMIDAAEKAGLGTGGTISGVGHYLKAQNPAVQIVGADPEGSVYSGGDGRPYLVEGIGEDFWPETYDRSVVDRVVPVTDRDSFLTARRVTREEGILIGGSGGTAIWAALEIGRELGPDHVVVVILPDSGRGYLSKVYDDDWMADYGFLSALGHTAGDILGRKAADLPALVHVHLDETVRAVISTMREFEVSQVPVVRAEPPLRTSSEVAGSVAERELMSRAFSDPAVLDRPVAEVMSLPLPSVGLGGPVDVVGSALDAANAVLVLDAGHPVGILTRTDLLAFLTGR